MQNQSANNKMIAKNTLMLYVRLFLLMGISFYMSRILLQILGVEDLGIYNVVGAIVTMMTFFRNSLSITTQRFLNYEMGKGRIENLNKIFSMSFWSYAIIALFIFIIYETVGLYFFYNYLNIPANRQDAAFWVYQFSILTFIFNLFTVPYNSTILAHEKMDFYAYVSIGDTVLKLVLIYTLHYINYDKLFLYALMMFLVTVFIWICNWWYCKKSFKESKLNFIWDKNLFIKIFSFSSWNSIGAIASSVNEQVVNILINIFFSPVANGARAIAYQVKVAVNSFAANFLLATRPQLFKSYAEGKLDYMNKLVFSSTKFSIYLLLIFILPILFNTRFILEIWLGEITPEMVTFTQLVLISLPVNTCFPILENISQAYGKVKWYQIGTAFTFLIIPVSTYILYKCGYAVEWSFIMVIIWDIIGVILRLLILRNDISFPICEYFKKAIFPPFLISTITLVVLTYPLSLIEFTGWRYVIISSGALLIVLLSVIWFIGLETYEKRIINTYIDKIAKRKQ